MKLIAKIVSGGQTGVDQAAWDAAIECGVLQDGWVPQGRITEAGTVPARYRCSECLVRGYPTRTRMNVAWGDATLILVPEDVTPGCQLTRKFVGLENRPGKLICLDRYKDREALWEIGAWLDRVDVPERLTLNVAGPRDSHDPGWAGRRVLPLLVRLLEQRGFVAPVEPPCGPEAPGVDPQASGPPRG